jgi:hypothetical protein
LCGPDRDKVACAGAGGSGETDPHQSFHATIVAQPDEFARSLLTMGVITRIIFW